MRFSAIRDGEVLEFEDLPDEAPEPEPVAVDEAADAPGAPADAEDLTLLGDDEPSLSFSGGRSCRVGGRR